MVFSSVTFLFFLLPAALAGYMVLPKKLKNAFLLLVSLVFYAWGEPVFVFVMLFSILMNWSFALAIDKTQHQRTRKILLGIGVALNLSLLFVYKYLNFSVDILNSLAGRQLLAAPGIVLPIGISFFTFQAISYVVDVYRKDGEVQRNPMNVALYISLFPQLVAGPIVRYQTVADEIKNRRTTLTDMSEGIARFVVGLAKKVLLANYFALLADRAFGAVGTVDLTAVGAWIGAAGYTLQIYFDFSGYSDMAIGLGRMFGFHFSQNFCYPYISGTITEFWRRWHISLGSWFRDYVYIPLGGSRVGKVRLVLNLLAVWLLTGLWHGANWTFVAWGALYFVLLTAEKLLKLPQRKGAVMATAYRLFTLLAVVFGWVLFRADSISQAGQYIASMFSGNADAMADALLLERSLPVLLIGMVLSCPVLQVVKSWWERTSGGDDPRSSAIRTAGRMLQLITLAALLAVSVSCVISSTYNPFIYFNF